MSFSESAVSTTPEEFVFMRIERVLERTFTLESVEIPIKIHEYGKRFKNPKIISITATDHLLPRLIDWLQNYRAGFLKFCLVWILQARVLLFPVKKEQKTRVSNFWWSILATSG